MQKIDIQYLIDLEEIKRLKYRFAWALETSKPHDLADLFTSDGWIDAGPWGRMTSQEKIRRATSGPSKTPRRSARCTA